MRNTHYAAERFLPLLDQALAAGHITPVEYETAASPLQAAQERFRVRILQRYREQVDKALAINELTEEQSALLIHEIDRSINHGVCEKCKYGVCRFRTIVSTV